MEEITERGATNKEGVREEEEQEKEKTKQGNVAMRRRRGGEEM